MLVHINIAFVLRTVALVSLPYSLFFGTKPVVCSHLFLSLPLVIVKAAALFIISPSSLPPYSCGWDCTGAAPWFLCPYERACNRVAETSSHYHYREDSCCLLSLPLPLLVFFLLLPFTFVIGLPHISFLFYKCSFRFVFLL